MNVMMAVETEEHKTMDLVFTLSSKAMQRKFFHYLLDGHKQTAFSVLRKYAKVIEYVPDGHKPTAIADLIINDIYNPYLTGELFYGCSIKA